MADWEQSENEYNADPEKYLKNLEVELKQQREAQELREATIFSNPKWTRPRIGTRRDYSERGQRGFHQSVPLKAAKRPALGITDLENHQQNTDRSQNQTVLKIFQNFKIELAANLIRGEVSDIPIPIIIHLAKSCIKSENKKEAFDQEIRSKEPHNINMIEECFKKAMTLSS